MLRLKCSLWLRAWEREQRTEAAVTVLGCVDKALYQWALILFYDFYAKDRIIMFFFLKKKKKKCNLLCWGQHRLQTSDSCRDSWTFQQMDAKVRGEALEILTSTDCKSTELDHFYSVCPTLAASVAFSKVFSRDVTSRSKRLRPWTEEKTTEMEMHFIVFTCWTTILLANCTSAEKHGGKKEGRRGKKERRRSRIVI